MTRRIEVVDVETLNLGSDHRAVIWRAMIGGKAWTFVTYNMGGRAKGADVVRLIEWCHQATPGRWTICLQETGDQRDVLLGVVDDVNAGDATDLAVDVELVNLGVGRFWQRAGKGKLTTLVPAGTLVTDGLVPLTDRAWVGLPGAGLSPWLAPKYVLRTRQRAGRTVVRVGNVHFVSSVLVGVFRRPLHARQLRRSLRWLRRQMDTPSALIGDYNADKRSRLLDPIREDRRLRLVGPEGSHGGVNKDARAIDLLTHN